MNFLKKQLSKAGSIVKDATDAIHPGSHPHQKTFLHGYLLIDIWAAKDLPNMEGWLSTLVIIRDLP